MLAELGAQSIQVLELGIDDIDRAEIEKRVCKPAGYGSWPGVVDGSSSSFTHIERRRSQGFSAKPTPTHPRAQLSALVRAISIDNTACRDMWTETMTFPCLVAVVARLRYRTRVEDGKCQQNATAGYQAPTGQTILNCSKSTLNALEGCVGRLGNSSGRVRCSFV